MPFRAPASGVLGPRPPFQPHQAMTAHHQLQLPAPTTPPSSAWDQQALLSALASVGGPQQQPPSSGDWFLDTGATTHMSNNPGILSSSSPVSSSSYITVGNGARLPVTHSACTSIPTSSTPFSTMFLSLLI